MSADTSLRKAFHKSRHRRSDISYRKALYMHVKNYLVYLYTHVSIEMWNPILPNIFFTMQTFDRYEILVLWIYVYCQIGQIMIVLKLSILFQNQPTFRLIINENGSFEYNYILSNMTRCVWNHHICVWNHHICVWNHHICVWNHHFRVHICFLYK